MVLCRFALKPEGVVVMGAGMSLICPKCRGAFENIRECPKCRVPLSDLGGRKDEGISTFAPSWNKPASGVGGLRDEPAPPRRVERWHQSPGGRLVSGILLSLGFSYGLLQLTATILRFMGKADPGSISPAAGLSLFYGLQAPAVFLAGMLSGVNRRRGAGSGALVGLISGIAAVVVVHSGVVNSLVAPLSSDLFSIQTPKNPIMIPGLIPVHQLTLIALPLVYLVFAVIGGAIGATLWRPAPEIATAVLISPSGPAPVVGLKTTIAMPKTDGKAPGLMSGPIGWIQVIAGIGVAVAGGSFATQPVRQFFIDFTDGMFAITTREQDNVTLMEVFAMSIVIGGAVSGACRANGLKQGLIVGFASGVGMVPFLAGGEQAKYTPFIILSALFLAPLGGWFGTTLLPPPPPPRLGSSTD
jgi:hypothetical protein